MTKAVFIYFVMLCPVMLCPVMSCTVSDVASATIKTPEENQYSVVNESNPKFLDIQKWFDIFSLSFSSHTNTVQAVSCIHLYLVI